MKKIQEKTCAEKFIFDFSVDVVLKLICWNDCISVKYVPACIRG